MKKRAITGHRIGEWHHKAKAASETVQEARRLRVEKGWSYARIGDAVGVPWRTVADWCNYRTRWGD